MRVPFHIRNAACADARAHHNLSMLEWMALDADVRERHVQAALARRGLEYFEAEVAKHAIVEQRPKATGDQPWHESPAARDRSLKR